MRKTLPILALLLAGCGGRGSSPASGDGTRGAATVSVAWPARSTRFVPLAANSVVVSLTHDGVTVRQTLVRSGDAASVGTARFSDLDFGSYVVETLAYPSADGTGVVQATGRCAMEVARGHAGTASVSLATTVASLAILPVAVDKNGTATAGVGALDAFGNAVLLATGDATEAIDWTADKVPNSLGAMVDVVTLSATSGGSVTLTGVHAGTTQIHASVSLGGAPVEASATVTVNAIDDGSGTVTVS